MKGKFLIEAIIVGKGKNYHYKFRTDQVDTVHEIEQFKYDITIDKLHLNSRNIFQRIFDKMRHVSNRFLIVFKEKQKKGITPDSTVIKIEGTDGEKPSEVVLSSSLLGVVDRSTILKNAFRDLFASNIGGRKILFIVIIVIVAGLIVLQATGEISLLGDWSL